MKKEKEGFTLIELLAVIIILAVIAIITTSVITDAIHKSKEEAMKRSMEFIRDAALNYYAVNFEV